jgi:predicted metal-dependent hydrolase
MINKSLYLIVILFIIFIIVYIGFFYQKEYFKEIDNRVLEIKMMLLPYFPELKKIKMFKDTSSYTVNKTKIALCTEKGKKKYDNNMLIYVTLHELAHVLNKKDYGHTPNFYKIFNKLLERAKIAGLYDENKKRPINYCKTIF